MGKSSHGQIWGENGMEDKTLIERMKTEGWNQQNGSPYYWQHQDGRKIERADNGNWYLLPIRGNRQVIGSTMRQAFTWAAGYAVIR